MLMLSKKVEYGLISLLHMSGLDRDQLVSAKEISEQYNIPAELLGKVLQSLAKANIVSPVHGAHGGYRLCVPLRQVTLGDVIETLEGPVHFARCQEDPATCGQFHTCNIKEPVLQIHDQLQEFIHGISLATFKRPVRPLAEARS